MKLESFNVNVYVCAYVPLQLARPAGGRLREKTNQLEKGYEKVLRDLIGDHFRIYGTTVLLPLRSVVALLLFVLLLAIMVNIMQRNLFVFVSCDDAVVRQRKRKHIRVTLEQRNRTYVSPRTRKASNICDQQNYFRLNMESLIISTQP